MLRRRGRFAPTPSGPLHFGSLIAALGSFLHSKSRGGEWLVRIDDLDQQRNVAQADTHILNSLENLGLHWDGPVLYQSSRIPAYQEAIAQLSKQDLIYPCSCSRKALGSRPYPGTCRHGVKQQKSSFSVRVRTDQRPVSLSDQIQGIFSQKIQSEVGDFILQRADGFIAYHLATVIDDQWQQISEVVRGADLLDSTPRQIYLQKRLGFTPPDYLHLPVANDKEGKKLGKSNGAIALDQSLQANRFQRSQLIYLALTFLAQNPPKELQSASLDECLQWGLVNWNSQLVPKQSPPVQIFNP